ncbi:hypothetical protein [uncultured Gimesia sp.]|uniref:hypothetical protein n=1 Tax=uncultured Gimesia sp. TaxID=1678688 RepID=UPI0030DCB50E|tara:strand:- start:71142 stop:71585 length:444 start_codon:yes stop_codon:yes gene_type:complete
MNKTLTFTNQLLFWGVLLSLQTLVGCSSNSDQLPTGEVHGTVTYLGKPLPAGSVTFIPDGTGKAAAGEIQADGTYTLTTYSKGDGATIGSHKVMIISEKDTSELPAESAEANVDLSLIPEKYGMSPKTSGLTAEVKAGDNEINFNLE